MIKVFKLNDDLYQILRSDKSQVEGNKKKIISTLLRDGFPVEEIALGIESLEYMDMADYGLNKTFIFAKKLV